MSDTPFLLLQSAADDGGGIYLLALELQHHILAYPDDKWVKSLPPEPQTPLEWPADSAAIQALNKSPGLCSQSKAHCHE
jgi:hypothetical protein